MAQNAVHTANHSQKQTRRRTGGIAGLLLGIFAGLAAWLLLLFAASALLVRCHDPARFVLPTALVLAALGACMAGFAATRLSGFHPVIGGTGAAAVFIAVLFGVSRLPYPEKTHSLPLQIVLIVILLSFSLLGAAMTKKGRRRRHGRRYAGTARK